MGLFDKIGEVIGDVVDGVVDFVDDVFNVDLKKILSNDIVKYGLMAVSLFTGGVAIANGVMTGFAQATGAKGFMGRFVAGADGFITGVKAGFADPTGTFSDLAGKAGELVSKAGDAMGLNPAGNQLQANVEFGLDSGAQEALMDMGDDAISSTMGGDPSLSGGQALSAQNQAAIDSAKQVASADPSAAAQEALSGGSVPNLSQAKASAAGGTGGVPTNVSNVGAEESIWSRIANSAKDFASSPAGMQTLANMASGWAEGAMIQERWDNERKDRRRAENSWTSGQYAPRAGGRLPSLQEMREQIQQRGNQANAKYGY